MFSKVNNAHAISKEGFVVKFDRKYVSYQDGKKAMHIEAEFAMHPTRLVIYRDSINHWFKPYETTLITTEEKNIIFERVLNALDFLGIKSELNS